MEFIIGLLYFALVIVSFTTAIMMAVLLILTFIFWVSNDYEEIENLENKMTKISYIFIPSSFLLLIITIFSLV